MLSQIIISIIKACVSNILSLRTLQSKMEIIFGKTNIPTNDPILKRI